MSTDIMPIDTRTRDEFVSKLLRGQLPPETVAAALEDAATVEAVYDTMRKTLNRTQTKIVALKAALEDEWWAPSLTPRTADLRHQLNATKVFLMHLQGEMPKWKRARSAHRNAATPPNATHNGHHLHLDADQREVQP